MGPDPSAARVSGRTAIIVAIITAVSGWAVAGLSIWSSQSPSEATGNPVSLASDLTLIENQKIEIAALEARLRCAALELKPILSEIPTWKSYMQLTAETTRNATARHSRTDSWFKQVDDVIEELQKTMHYTIGQRKAC